MAREIFCNWFTNQTGSDQCDFLNIGDIDDCDMIFFDPVNFAITAGFRQNVEDLWEKEYMQYSEQEYHDYLKNIKATIDQIKKFFDRDGIMVIRSAFPNTDMTVRKKSSSSMGQYTSLVISPFFWLEGFIGKYSFPYVSENKIRFKDKKNMLNEFFQNTTVVCQQVQASIQNGQKHVIAVNNKKPPQPVITRVTMPSGKGSIFFIPKFLIKDEDKKLVTAFRAIKEGQEAKEYRPNWITDFEKELEMANPFMRTIDEINLEIEKLERRRKSIRKRDQETKIYIDLLFQSGNELFRVVKKAFRLMGFYLPDIPPAVEKAGFKIYLRDKEAANIVVHPYSTINGPVEVKDLEDFDNMVKAGYRNEKPFGMIISNAEFVNSPRRRKKWFSDELIEKNRSNEYCLITTNELFELVCYLISKSESDIKEEIKQSLRRDILGCTELFTFNRKKYLSTAR